MTTLPAEVTVGHRTYRVVRDSAVVDAHQPEGGSWQAFSDPRDQLIAVRSDSGPDDEADSVLHEVLHQCLRASGCWPGQVRPSREVDLEEIVVAAISGPLLRALRDNPALVAYLVGGSAKSPGESP